MRPLLAATVEDLYKLRYPLLASPKLDGIRALVLDRSVYSRSGKRLPNEQVQMLFGRAEFDWLDGELILGPPTDSDVYRRTMSAVMSDNVPAVGVTYHVFDCTSVLGRPFYERLKYAKEKCNGATVKLLTQIMVNNPAEVLTAEEAWISKGYEGVMLRDPEGKYKQGRSTLREGILMKLKRFKDDEATIIAYTELMHNTNEAKSSELGYTVRTSHKENMVGMNTLGALIVKWQGRTFSIGTGFSAAQRAYIWSRRERYLGELVKFKYLEVGMKDLPRHPVFLGWRDPIDA